MSRLLSGLQRGEFIGNGFFGRVYQGLDQIHGAVAIKEFRQRADESLDEWQERKSELLFEGQKLKQAKHRNVVEVHHIVASEDGQQILLVMELCRGGSLQNAFEAGPMMLQDLRRYATELALGLQALHTRGMLHRDIKPANLLIDSAGVAKLGDFGLVTDKLVFGYGERAGYRDHLAIEVRDGGPTSARSDIWAFGMTIYRLLHGATWYAASPPPASLIPQGGFANRLRWLSHIPDGWRRFVRKCMHDDPYSRYATATELMNAIASLPTEPDWRCTVQGSTVDWQRETETRIIRARVIFHSDRKHEWTAWSEPRSGAGRNRTLSTTQGLVSPSLAAGAMRQFFSS